MLRKIASTTRSYKDILRFAFGKELEFASIKNRNVLYYLQTVIEIMGEKK